MLEGPSSSTGSILSHSTISNNEADGGGGWYMGAYTYLAISFTSFTGNRAKQGAAIQTFPSSHL
eukprot:COSAG06_NODE_24765_length_653_cov_0.916968_1_plen_63_part_10